MRESTPTFAEFVEGIYLESDPPASPKREDTLLAGHRIGMVTNLPAQYRIPLFGSLAERLRSVGAAFRVFFLRESGGGRPWIAAAAGNSFDSEVLPSFQLPIRRRAPAVPTSLERSLAAFGPTVLVSAGFSPLVSGRVARFARTKGVAFGVWSGEHEAMPTARSKLRRWQRQRLLASADFGISYGSASGDYLSTLHTGLPVVYGRNTSIGSGTSPASKASDRVEILAVGDLTSGRKGIDVLVGALAQAPSLACRLTVVGGGSDQAALRRRSAGDPRIIFTGPKAPGAVREAYEAADVFVFPSRSDVFGLALVEAMCSGLAVATSAPPGAVADLCVDGHNSLVVRSYEPDEWAAALTRLVEDRALRERLGREANRTISRRWTIEHASDAMIAGLRLGALAAEGGGVV
jgi:hypothetical protein